VTRPPKIILRTSGVREYAVVSLELVHPRAALDLAKRLADRTGRTVVVRDGDQEHLGTFDGARLN
jgi:hypothetical protein